VEARLEKKRDEEERQLDFSTASKEFVNPPNIKWREQTKRMIKRLPHAKNGWPKLIFDGITFIKTQLI
jgi:hypothetical protein